MNQYKSNHEFYQSVFDEVHASDELIMKVQNMTDNKTKKKVYAIRKIAIVAAAVMLMFVASNAIVYAATGATWVEHLITATIDGQDRDANLIDKYDENGNIKSQEILIDYGNGMKEGLEWDGEYAIDPSEKIEIGFVASHEPSIVKENDKVYLDWEWADIREDITEDIADGHAEVTVTDDNNEELKISVTESDDKYKIIVSSRGEAAEFFSNK